MDKDTYSPIDLRPELPHWRLARLRLRSLVLRSCLGLGHRFGRGVRALDKRAEGRGEDPLYICVVFDTPTGSIMETLSSSVPFKTFPIDEMPTLKARLGKAKTDRIRYITSYTFPRPLSARNTPNPHLAFMQFQTPHDGGPVDDIIQGIARLDHHSRSSGKSIPLSVSRLYNILQCMPVINTQEISYMLGIDTRQAQKYQKAVKMILFHIQRHIEKEMTIT